MDAARLSSLETQEQTLVEERHQLVLKMLQLALADVNHHLQLEKTRNQLTLTDIAQLK